MVVAHVWSVVYEMTWVATDGVKSVGHFEKWVRASTIISATCRVDIMI